MREKPCIIITRPLEDAKETARLLEAIGVSCFIEPMLKIENIPSSIAKLKNALCDCDGIIITSKNAVRAISDINSSIKIICIGESTALFAKECGFSNVECSGKNIKELCYYVKMKYSGKKFIYASGEVITQELDIKNCGNIINRIVVYKTIPTQNFSEIFKQKLKEDSFDGLLLCSKKTAEKFYKILEKEKMAVYTKRMAAFCLSENIAEVIAKCNFKAVFCGKNANIGEMAGIIGRVWFE